MAIEVTCPNCQGRFEVPDRALGKRFKCPECQHVSSVAEVSGTRRQQESAESWWAKTDDGQQYGPMPRGQLDEWVDEGRVTADWQVLRDGGDQWQWANDVYPQLAIGSRPRQPAAADMSVPEKPTSGFPVIDTSRQRSSQSGGRVPSSQAAIVIQQQSDPAGVISLIMGVLAFLLMIVGCLSCGVLGFVVYPLAIVMSAIGAVAGYFARGNLQVAGILLNVLVLIPVALMMIMMMMGVVAAGAAGAR